MVFKFSEKMHDPEVLQCPNYVEVLWYIGADLEQFKVYFVEVSLWDCGGDWWEYAFAVIERDVMTRTHERYYSSRETARIFSEDDKCAVLSVMALATDKLLRIKKPLNIKRVSYDEDVPEKALGKHHMASGVMAVHGYIVQKCDVWNGKRVLLANLRLQPN